MTAIAMTIPRIATGAEGGFILLGRVEGVSNSFFHSILATVDLGSRNLCLEAREGFLILIWTCSMLSRNHYILLIEITMLIKGRKHSIFITISFVSIFVIATLVVAVRRRDPPLNFSLRVVLKNQVEREEV